MTIVDLSQAREQREQQGKAEPTITGSARCIACKHEWQAVAPAGAVWLDCPKCETSKGLFKGPCAPPDGGYIWRCNCGCDVFFITPQATMCCQCGVAQGDLRP